MIRPKTEMKDSGIEWIGDIPKEWDVQCLKYAVQITSGSYISKDEYVDDGEFPIIGSNGEIGRCSKKNISHPVITTGRVGSIGTTQLVENAWVTDNTLILDVCNNFNRKYVSYVVPNFDFKQIVSGTAQPLITATKLKNQYIPLICKKEQRAIADYLDKTCSKIDEIIAEAKASIDEYKKLRIAAVNDAVTHGIYNNAIKDSNVDWIGKIPDNWKIIITKRLFKIKKDIAGKEGYKVLSITQKGIVPKVFGGKGQFAADYSNYQIVNKGDFAMNHMDLLTGWLDISEYDGVTSPDYRVFVPTGYEDIYTPYYKYVMQNCYSCKIYYGLGHGVAGMGRWRLPADMFLNFKLPMPPKTEQKDIADFLDKRTAEIDSLIAEKESLIKDLESYKKSLIYEVVTGKRRVV